MNTTSRTLVFAGVAAFAAIAAMGVRYANQPASVEGFSDVGQAFFADFKDPLKASELSVSKYDPELKEPLAFTVKQNDQGLWVIPSHHDYPAEAAARLAKTASSLIGISKVALQSRSKDDWARYGVEDPAAEVAVVADSKGDEKDESRGTRITLRDSSSNALVDLIVGKAVEGREKHFYVRQPEKNPVFIAKLDADLSAKFSDWIEPDLLKLNQNDIVQVVVDRYSIDEEQGAILQGEKYEFSKDKTSSKWAMAGLDPNVESLKETAVTDITRNLDQLKIVGVRPKPQGLNPDLTVSPEVAGNPLLRQVLQADMQRQGFYIARGEGEKVKLVSNEGELIAGTNNGVRYTLYFGEIARGTAKDIEVGLKESKPAEGDNKTEGEKTGDANSPDAAKPEDKPDTPESGPRRYLLVKVEYDEALLGPKPEEPVAPVKPAILTEGAPETPENNPADAPTESTPADAPKEDGSKPENPNADAPSEVPKDAPPAEEKPAAETPAEPPAEPTPEPPAEPTPETPAEPGSCDEPAAAEPAAETPVQETPAASTEPAAQDPAVPAVAADPAPAQEGQPQPTTDEKPQDPAPVDPNAPEPAQPPADPKAEAQKQYDQAMGEYEAAKAGYEGALKTWEGKTKEGRKKVDELSTRFGGWYYVITADSFDKFKLTREAVVGPKVEEKPGSPAPGGGLLGPDAIPDFDPQGK